jgi:hypothetical protein
MMEAIFLRMSFLIEPVLIDFKQAIMSLAIGARLVDGRPKVDA